MSDSLRRRVWPLLVGLSSCVPPVHQPLQPLVSSNNSNSNATNSNPLVTQQRSTDEADDDTTTQRSLHETDELSPLASSSNDAFLNASFTTTGSHSHITNEDLSVADSATTISRCNHNFLHSRHRLLRRCKDHYQIDLDVARCTWHLLTGDQRAQRYQMEHKRNRQVARIIRRKQRRLGLFINLTLLQSEETNNNNKGEEEKKEERLRYYQGYHDVACIFLTTLAGGSTWNASTLTTPTTAFPSSSTTSTPTAAATTTTAPTAAVPPPPIQQQQQQQPIVVAPPALELPARVLYQVSQSHLRDYLKDNFVDLQTALRLTVFPLLAFLDPAVHDHLYAAEMEPFFCLSWIITWFAHEVRDSALVKRLFDAFLVSHPLLPLYVSIAMVVHPINRQVVLETEPDFAILHQTLRGLPRNSSMVGWKYRPGDGYVSDDEEDDDDDDDEVAAVEARLDAAVDGDIHQLRSVLDKEGMPTGATSSVSTGTTSAANGECHARVPFQELMDLAVRFMKAVPPRHLLTIAKRYYGKAHVRTLMEDTNSIELLKDVPSWAIQPTLVTETPPKVVKRILRQKKQSKAVLALGLGISDIDRRRRRQIRFWVGVVAVAVLAMAVAWSDHESVWKRMQYTLGWSSSPGDSSNGIFPTDVPKAASPDSTTPRVVVGSAMRHSLVYGESTISVDGNVEPVVVNPKAFVSIHDYPVHRPGHMPEARPKTSGGGSGNEKFGEGWFDFPIIKWMRSMSAQERLEKHMENLGSHVGRLLFSRKNDRPMITDGRKARVARKLKPLRNFLSKPLDEMWQEGKKIAWDQTKIVHSWLNHPHCFSENCDSGKGRSRL